MKKLFSLSLLLSVIIIGTSQAQTLSHFAGPTDPYEDMDETYSRPGKNLNVTLEAQCTTASGSTGGAVCVMNGADVMWGWGSWPDDNAAVATYYDRQYEYDTCGAYGLDDTFMLIVWGAYGGWGIASAYVY